MRTFKASWSAMNWRMASERRAIQVSISSNSSARHVRSTGGHQLACMPMRPAASAIVACSLDTYSSRSANQIEAPGA